MDGLYCECLTPCTRSATLIIRPYYDAFELPAEDVDECLELCGRAIVISSWLAAVTRRELSRFKEFICWLKHGIILITPISGFAIEIFSHHTETIIANPSNDTHPSPRHDILEVNSYLMSGLVVSSIDKWFMGPVPRFSSRDLGVLGDKEDLSAVIERAKKVANDPSQIDFQTVRRGSRFARPLLLSLETQNVKQNDLSHLDRNLDALIQELTVRCHRLFARASAAATRSAAVSYRAGSVANQAESTWPSSFQTKEDFVFRERIINNANEVSDSDQIGNGPAKWGRLGR
jgi:anaphase-promoting complex subunit 4